MTYNLLKENGFFCYCCNREGDLFRSNKPQFKGIKLICTYKGVDFNFKGVYYEDLSIKDTLKVLGLI